MKAGNYDGRIISKHCEEFFKVVKEFEKNYGVRVVLIGYEQEEDDYLSDDMDLKVYFEDSFIKALSDNEKKYGIQGAVWEADIEWQSVKNEEGNIEFKIIK